MAKTAKILAYSDPAAGTDTDIYEVPEETETVVSSIIITNRHASTADTCRVAVRPKGAALANEHYILYDYSVAASNYHALVAGITLGSGDIVTVRDANGTLSFHMFGIEATLR